MKTLFVIAWVILVVGLLLFFLYPIHAHAHQAASGWTYPSSCCGGKDCRPIKEGLDVTAAKNGSGYMVKFLYREPGNPITYYIQEFVDRDKVQSSGDSDYHACVNVSALPGQQIRCLFAPTTM